MNHYQNKLYSDLITLVGVNEAFYYVDQELDGVTFRIFLYRLASYTDFLWPSALESRGIMFQMIDVHGELKPARLVCMPMEKFFNYRENPMTMNVNWFDTEGIELKADGSLISTYYHKGLKLKSKGSLFSDQAMDAMAWLDTQPKFKEALESLALHSITVNLEWCSPNNRIVIGYMEPELRVLNMRALVDGRYIEKDATCINPLIDMEEIRSRWVDDLRLHYSVSVSEFVEQIPDMEDIEGFVIRLKNGQRVKLKTQWYLTRHRTKDSVNCPRRLFEAVLEEATDDLRTLFFDDPLALKKIADMEAFAEQKYNHMVDTVERFYERNKDLERKDYALLGQKELPKMFFGLAMNKWLGKPVNYKEFLKGKWKQLGLKDETIVEE